MAAQASERHPRKCDEEERRAGEAEHGQRREPGEERGGEHVAPRRFGAPLHLEAQVRQREAPGGADRVRDEAHAEEQLGGERRAGADHEEREKEQEMLVALVAAVPQAVHAEEHRELRGGKDRVLVPEDDEDQLGPECQGEECGPRPLVLARDAIAEGQGEGEDEREPDHDRKRQLAARRGGAERARGRERAGPGLGAREAEPAQAKEVDHRRPET